MNVETYQRNGWTVKIDYDEGSSFDPHADMTPACQFLFEHKRYTLPNDAGVNLDDFSTEQELMEHLEDIEGALVIKHVYMYEHSGVALSVSNDRYPFTDPWDSGTLGLAYVTRKNWADTQGTEWTGSQDQLDKARSLIEAEVDVYGKWLNGEVFGYRIIDPVDDEEVDSCWGIIGYEYVEEEANMSADHTEHTPKCTGIFNRTEGKIDHATPNCPLHPNTIEGNNPKTGRAYNE